MQPSAPKQRVETLLRSLVVLFIIGGSLQVASAIINLFEPSTLAAQGVARADVPVFVSIAIVLTVAITGGAIVWVRFCVRALEARSAKALRHTKRLALVLIALGVLGVASGIPTMGTFSFATAALAALTTFAIIAFGISAATAVLGVAVFRRCRDATLVAEFPASGTSA